LAGSGPLIFRERNDGQLAMVLMNIRNPVHLDPEPIYRGDWNGPIYHPPSDNCVQATKRAKSTNERVHWVQMDWRSIPRVSRHARQFTPAIRSKRLGAGNGYRVMSRQLDEIHGLLADVRKTGRRVGITATLNYFMGLRRYRHYIQFLSTFPSWRRGFDSRPPLFVSSFQERIYEAYCAGVFRRDTHLIHEP